MTPIDIIRELDKKLIRIGSTLIGVDTAYSDIDYAVSTSTWAKLKPTLTEKLGFTSVRDDGYNSSNYPMFNESNEKMIYLGTEFDFIIYRDDNIDVVRCATNKFKDFVVNVPSISMKTKRVRVETFHYFLKTQFLGSKSDIDDVADLFSDL